MARPLRIGFPGAFHHVTNRGARRQDIFYCPQDRLEFLRLIAKAHQRFGVLVHSFCLMTNHIHLIIETPEGGLSQALHLIESTYVQGFNRRHGLDGPLLKGRFYSRLIQQDLYLKLAIRYVERNPLEAGLVTHPTNYPWSSYRLFAGGPAAMPDWLSSRALRSAGIRTPQQLESFVMAANPALNLKLENYGPVVGDDDFTTSSLNHASTDQQTIGHARQAQVRPTASDVDRAVAAIFNTPASKFRQRAPGSRSDARLAAVGLQQDLAGEPLSSVAQHFGFTSAQSAGTIASRFRRREQNDPKFDKKVKQVRQLLHERQPITFPHQ